MAANNKVPYGQGGPVPRNEPEPAPVPEPKSCSRWACGKGYVVAAVFMFACLAVMFLMIVMPGGRVTDPKWKMEQKQLGDLGAKLRQLRNHSPPRPALAHVQGEEFWSAALGNGLIPDTFASKIVSLNSVTDSKAGKEWIQEGGHLPPNSCSYTAPNFDELREVFRRTGRERCVVVTFNARNWDNYEEGVLVLWSDGDEGEWLTFEDASQEFGITAEEWADPAGNLFGKKVPFQFTYE